MIERSFSVHPIQKLLYTGYAGAYSGEKKQHYSPVRYG